MAELFSQPPWYLPIAIGMVAIALIFQGNARQNRRLKYAGIAVAFVAATLAIAGYFLESEREQVVRRTEEIAAAINDRNWPAFAERLDPDVRALMYDGRKDFADGAAKSADTIGVKNIALSNFVVTPETGAYRVDFRAMADIDVTARRTPTDWRFYWARDPSSGVFLLYNVEFVPNAQFGQDTVMSRLVRP